MSVHQGPLRPASPEDNEITPKPNAAPVKEARGAERLLRTPLRRAMFTFALVALFFMMKAVWITFA